MASPAPKGPGSELVREIEAVADDLIPHNISPFRGIGRRGGGIRFPRFTVPHPSQATIGRPNAQQPPAPPPAPKPAPASKAAAPAPFTVDPNKPAINQAPAPVAGGLGRRKPGSAAQSMRQAMVDMLGPELGRRFNAYPADVQQQFRGIYREKARDLDVRSMNEIRELLRNELHDMQAGRAQSPDAVRQAAARAARAEGKAVGPAADAPTGTPPRSGRLPGAADAAAVGEQLRQKRPPRPQGSPRPPRPDTGPVSEP